MKRMLVPIALGFTLLLLLGACVAPVLEQEAKVDAVQDSLPSVTVYKSPT